MQNLNNLLKKAFKITSQIYSEEITNRQQVSYRITQLPTKEDPYVYYQLVGKNLATKTLPEVLLTSDALMGFSKADIAVITYLGAQKQMAEQQSTEKAKRSAGIAQQLFATGGKTKFLLKMPEQEQLVEAIPEEVMMNHDALDMLSGKDAAMLGYAAAENRLINIRQQVSQAPTCHILEHDLIEKRVTYLDEERDTRHTLPLHDIFNNKKLLNLFNKIDQQMISFAAGEAHQQRLSSSAPALTIISQSNDTLICQDSDGQEQVLLFIDIAFNEDLLSSFSVRDQHLIRFVAGELHAARKTHPQPTLTIVSRSEDHIEYIDPDGITHSDMIELLAFNRDLLEQFSIMDREQISYAAGELHQKRLNPKRPITLTLISYLGDTAQFTSLDGNIEIMRFQDLAFRHELLDQFCQQDRDMIRFAAGELSAQEKITL